MRKFSTTVLWVASLTVSLSLLILAAGAGQPILHACVCAAMVTALAFVALSDNHSAVETKQPERVIAALNARHMALIWVWGALALFTVYGTGMLFWPEWWRFMLAFVVAGGVALLMAFWLGQDDLEPAREQRLLTYSRYLAWGQLFGMGIVAIGLVLDSKMDGIGIAPFGTRNVTEWKDWAGNNVFFFGAIGLVVQSWLALRSTSKSGSLPLSKASS